MNLSFVLPLPPSSKNARRARLLPNGRIIQFRPRDIVTATEQIQTIALQAMREAGATLIEDDDVHMSLIYEVERNCVRVEVNAGPPRPKGRTGRKRDAVNLPELICDALQGIAYTNDRQIARLFVLRVYD